ncbi:MAG: alpha/beta fold hydrolase [Euryarchaeota archaeon]|nr:alpha/beta fold hydrolase [Euryarchaeota archaeon]
MIAVGVVLLITPIVAYLMVGWQIYITLGAADPGYGDQAGHTPAQFNVTWDDHVALDTSPYFMESYEEFSIPSRTEGITISGWWVEAENVTQPAPTVIIQHGIRSSKASYQVLMSAGMLHKNGFNTVMIDLRDHGISTVEDGRVSIGTKEYIDVMSLVDWLIENQSIPESKIGMLGNSMGAGTAAISFGQDTRIHAVALDSGYLNLDEIVEEELERTGYPTWLFNGALLSAWLFGGESLLDPAPTSAFENAGQRPVFIIHGKEDARVNVHHSEDMLVLAETYDVNATAWFVEGAGHVEVKLLHPQEYEEKITDFFNSALA